MGQRAIQQAPQVWPQILWTQERRTSRRAAATIQRLADRVDDRARGRRIENERAHTVAAPDITYLVLSAITRPRDAIRAANGYRQLGTNALCVTRLDETDDHATVTDVASATGLPLGWLGVGQEVPDDLREADATTLAALVKGGHAA